MTYVPTTTVSILRGASTTDTYGDEVESTTVHLSGIPAALTERTRRVFGPTAGQDRTVRYSICRLPYGTDVVDTDRIRDEATGDLYVIDAIRTNDSPVHATDVVLDLRRTT